MQKHLRSNRLIRNAPWLIVLFLLLSLPISSIYADANSWSSLRAPEGGSILSLAINPLNPSIIYAGTQFGGIYRSSDGATTWSAINTGLPPPRSFSPLFSPISKKRPLPSSEMELKVVEIRKPVKYALFSS